jgi:heme-degrading monooxygenase HmoA
MTKSAPSILVLLLLAVVPAVQGFAPASRWNAGRSTVTVTVTAASARNPDAPRLAMATVEAVDTDVDMANKGLMKRDRYIATNRFAVRKDQQAKFEKRWTVRKSRLATLPGFKYFHLMRRVDLNDNGTASYKGGETEDEAQSNYVSFTVWDKKSDFSAWRSGEAFKEAHGGTSIGAFLTTMISSAFVLRGAPRPAFYDALLMASKKPENMPPTVDGWRQVEADGENTLPAECFVGMENFFVPPEHASAFENFWATASPSFDDFEGFVAFSVMRRDGQAKGHGMVEMSMNEPTYVATLVFKDRMSFETWSSTHGSAPPKEGADAPPPPPKMWDRAPEKVYYEGTLVITGEEGA